MSNLIVTSIKVNVETWKKVKIICVLRGITLTQALDEALKLHLGYS
jgi:hypothetical protein